MASHDKSPDTVTDLFDMLHIIDSQNQKRFYEKFESLKTHTECFNFVYSDVKKRLNLDHKLKPDNGKSDDCAVMYRESGNTYFGSGNYLKALEEYTRSIASALSDVFLAMAYANRSACLYKLGMFNECLIDIERALKNNYPDKLKPKLIVRRENAEKLLQPKEKYFEEIPKIADSKKKSAFACASKSVNYTLTYPYAARDIGTGEVICVEKPLICVLKSTDYLIHCHECLELCYNPIPCDSCQRALFCGESCKEKALIYHKFECSFLEMLQDLNPKLYLVIRLAILAKDNKQILNEWRVFGSEILNPHILVPLTLSVVKIFHILKTNTDFFQNEKAEDNFKEIVLSRVRSLSCPWKISIHEYAKSGRFYERNHFANGFYSFASFMNQADSTNPPNMECTFYGSTVVLRTVTPIRKSEICFFKDDYEYYHRICPYSLLSTREILISSFTMFMDAVDNEDLTVRRFLEADVKLAKEILPQVIMVLDNWWLEQMRFPCSVQRIDVFREILVHCYDTFGNKKRI